MAAAFIFGEVREGKADLTARLHVFAKDLVLLVRAGVPTGEDQHLVVVDQEVRRNVVVHKADNVRLTVRRCSEVQVLVGQEHFRLREDHIVEDAHTGFRSAGDPAGIVFRDLVRSSNGTVEEGAAAAEVKVPLHETDGRFRLTGRCGIFLGVVIEIGNDLAVFHGDRGTVADVDKEFFRFLHQAGPVFFIDRVAAGIVQAVAGTGHGLHGGVFAEGGLERPVAAFVDDHFCAGHVLEIHGSFERIHLVRVLVGQIGIPFMRQVGTPDRQVEGTVETAVQSGGERQVAEGEVFRAGNFHARCHFVVDIVVGAGRHDQTPIPFMTVVHPVFDLLYEDVGGILQAGVLCLFFGHIPVHIGAPGIEAHGEAFAEVIAEIELAQFFETLGCLFRGIRIKRNGVETGFFRFLHQVPENISFCPELQKVALVVLLTKFHNVTTRGRIRSDPVTEAASTAEDRAFAVIRVTVNTGADEYAVGGQLDLVGEIFLRGGCRCLFGGSSLLCRCRCLFGGSSLFRGCRLLGCSHVVSPLGSTCFCVCFKFNKKTKSETR